MNDLFALLGKHPETIEAIVLTILAITVFRLAIPVLFQYRTKIQQALEATYGAHIDELKSMVEESRREAEDCRLEVTKLRHQVFMMTEFFRVYNCRLARDCPQQESVALPTLEDGVIEYPSEAM